MLGTHGAGFGLAISFLVLLGLIGVYEVYAIFCLPGDETVSYHLRQWSYAFLGLPLAIGFILGHLFFPMRGSIPPQS